MFGQIVNCPRAVSAQYGSRFLTLFILLSIQFALGLIARASASTQEVNTLELGRPIARELSGGQKHVYQLALAQGQCANVTVQQPGIDLSVKLYAVDGKLITEFDNESRNQGREILEFVAEAPGNYRLEISPTVKSAPAGRYEIRLNEARDASAA